LKLEGVKVLDLSSFLPGPYLTMSMADHGAEVIKIEAPGGDHGRTIGPPDGDHSVFFRNFNRGKHSVVLDMKQPAEREILLGLCETADVFVETFRPGVAARLGVDYAAVSSRNPRIVYCSISAFGQHGPYRDRPAHDLAVQALAGVISITRGNDGQPALPGIPVADVVAGLQGLSAVAMALFRRAQTGRGDYIDISMHDCMVSASGNVLGPAIAQNRQQEPKLERTTGGAAFYRIYETRDGRHMALGGQEEKFIRSLLGALGREDLIPLCRQGPGAHQAPVIAYFQTVFRTRTLAEWIAFMTPLDVCFGQINTFPEALADPHLRARGMVLKDEQGHMHVAPPIRFSDEPAVPNLATPLLDEHRAKLRGGFKNEKEARSCHEEAR
jgi:crotonobetainyl-CoA:carnitine CoA-transferase CaiB-like acyl-CoA transferase